MCPAPSSTVSSAPAICSASGVESSAGISVSPVEVTTPVGTSMVGRSGVESGRSAIPSEAAAIDSAG